jgi:hypothetical protein
MQRKINPFQGIKAQGMVLINEIHFDDQYLAIVQRLAAQRTFAKRFKSSETLAAVSELLKK